MEAQACECSPFILQPKAESQCSSWLDQDVCPELGTASRQPGSLCAVAAVPSQRELRCEAVQAIPSFQGR